MFDFVLSLPFLVGLVLGALIGVGLGRRSKTANEYYDRARAAWDLREAQLQAKIDELKAKSAAS
jgi:hypothetical protein